MIAPLPDAARARRLKPRQWSRLAAELRAYPVDANWPTDISAAHRQERRRRRPELVAVVCSGCGEVLATARPGALVLCRSCRVWSGSAPRNEG